MTTVRLWWRRHVWLPMDRPQRSTRGYRRVSIAALALAVVAGGATAIGLALARSPAEARSPQQGTADPPRQAADTPAALADAAASRQRAAAWIAAQVGRDVIVACDPLMCTILGQHGFPAGNLAQLSASATDPLGSGLVVSTTAVRSELGSRLVSVYAPIVVASFGTGTSQVQVRVIATGGSAAAYVAAESSDVHARAVAGRYLLHNTNMRVPAAAARRQLAAGQVDSRLLIVLAALAHKYPVYVRTFGDSGPGAAASVPLRSIAITAAGRQYLPQVLALLRAQRAPLLAQTTVRHAGNVTILTIEFSAPSPPGLLPQN
jgi:hypothetical protein